ncbi:ParB/RepB/Spo0J family partition protein [Ruminococcus sp. Marseille-P6503]|uniref:ParB/RepB/Spo0J family partition protein n=1 Tax=Ruminococcus sp. Marseille-P6503 TaxID=2364796 RepID=UPI000F538813|nr:ParB/RepB/Spo0J family partition protein [Ruminococcus sp. Marseille-P6503]
MSIITKTREKTSAQNVRELGKVVEIPVGAIFPNPDQPRKSFNTEDLTRLAKSISQDGIVQPLTVRRKEGGYELVSGERRLRAAKLAGFRSVPCVVVDISDSRSAVIAIIENIQRAELNFFEEAEAISALITKYGMTQEDCAIRLGMAQSTVANKLRILKLSPDLRKVIVSNGLTERHARALLKADESLREEVLIKIVKDRLTVDAAEKYIRTLEKNERIRQSYRRRSAALSDLRLFFNTVDKAVQVIKLAGVDARVKKTKKDGFIEYVIRVPEEGENRKSV